MNLKSTRKQRAYKVEDYFYVKAKEKANKTGKPLANRIEEFVIEYSGAKDKKK